MPEAAIPATGVPWVDLFGQLGSFGIVCFVIWWTFTKTQPRYEQALSTAQEAFHQSLKTQEETHQKATAELLRALVEGRTLFQKMLEEERAAHSSDIDRIIEEMRRMNAILVYIVGQLRGKELTADERQLIGLVVKTPPPPTT